MRVQVCPSCGARYNVAQLDDGMTFQCKRCPARVTVGSTAGAGRRTTSAALSIAGLLLIGALFLKSNPEFGETQDWPWETFQRSASWLRKITVLAWAAAGVWAFFSGLVPAGRTRGSVALVLTAALAVLCTNGFAGLDVQNLRLPQLLGVIALGAGLLLLGRSAPSRTGWVLALLGGAALVLWHVTLFPPGEDRATVAILWDDLVTMIRGGSGPTPYSNPDPGYEWKILIPEWLGIAAGVMGILAAFGVRWRAWCVTAFLVLLVSLVLPTAVAFAKSADALTHTVVTSRVLEALVADAVALFVLGTLAIVDLTRAAENTA
jgi:hypothetical protein